MLQTIVNIQLALLLLTAFICGAGLVYFFDCLAKVIRCMGHTSPDIDNECAWRACWGMVCLSGLWFSFARANTLGVAPWGQVTGGASFVIACACMIAAIGMSLWATIRQHGPDEHSLAKVLATLLALMLIFGAVGVAGAQ